MDNQKRILYVDDEQINLVLFQSMFNKYYGVTIAESGIQALNLLESMNTPDVVISDMRMPGMNGLEFIAAACEKYPMIDFYILTGYEITDEIQEALNQGVIKHYFQKPFKMKELSAAIEAS
ncbi:response regulator [Salinivirga cyanobacteriivorans]